MRGGSNICARLSGRLATSSRGWAGQRHISFKRPVGMQRGCKVQGMARAPVHKAQARAGYLWVRVHGRSDFPCRDTLAAWSHRHVIALQCEGRGCVRGAKRRAGVRARGANKLWHGERAWGWRRRWYMGCESRMGMPVRARERVGRLPRARCAGGVHVLGGCALPHHRATVLVGRRCAQRGWGGTKGRPGVRALPRPRAPVRVGRRCARRRWCSAVRGLEDGGRAGI